MYWATWRFSMRTGAQNFENTTFFFLDIHLFFPSVGSFQYQQNDVMNTLTRSAIQLEEGVVFLMRGAVSQ